MHHRVGVVDLHTDHLDVRPHGLDVGGDARDEATTADSNKHRVDIAGSLAQNLHRDRALTGDHIGIIKGVHEREAVLASQQRGMCVGVGVAVAEQHHVGTVRAYGFDLHFWSGHRHDHGGATSQLCGAHGDTLRVVASRRANDTARPLVGRQVDHLVVRAAQLETEDRLRVLTLEEHRVANARGEARSDVERSLYSNVVHPRREDLLQVVVQREVRVIRLIGRHTSA